MTKSASGIGKSNPPDNGNNTIGKSAVTAMGIASVIHQTAIHDVEASTALASVDKPSGLKYNRIIKNKMGPSNKPMRLVLFI